MLYIRLTIYKKWGYINNEVFIKFDCMDKGVLDLHIQVKFHIITPQLYEYLY